MGDWPGSTRLQPSTVLSTVSPRCCPVADFLATSRQAINANGLATANLGLAFEVVVNEPRLVQSALWMNGAPAGTVYVGVYDRGTYGLKGSVSAAMSGSSVPQGVAFGSPFTIDPGVYLIALSATSGSASFLGYAPSTLEQGTIIRACGASQMAAAAPLPSTWVPATFATARVPIFGVVTTPWVL